MATAIFELRPESEWMASAVGLIAASIADLPEVEAVRVPDRGGKATFDFVAGTVTGPVTAGKRVVRTRNRRPSGGRPGGQPRPPQPQLEVGTARQIRHLKADPRFRLISETP